MTYPFNEKLYHPQLQCVVYEIRYFFKLKLGILIMGDNSCCDMTGCINFFKNIDSNIQQIQTFAGETRDTIYSLNIDNEWTSVLPK